MSLEDKGPLCPRPGLGRRGGPPSPAFDCRRLGLAAAAISLPLQTTPAPGPPSPAPTMPSPSGDPVAGQGSDPGPDSSRAPTPAGTAPLQPAPARWERSKGRLRGSPRVRGTRRLPADAQRPAGTRVRPLPTKWFGGRVTLAVGGPGRSPALFLGSVWPPGLGVSPAGPSGRGPGPGGS